MKAKSFTELLSLKLLFILFLLGGFSFTSVAQVSQIVGPTTVETGGQSYYTYQGNRSGYFSGWEISRGRIVRESANEVIVEWYDTPGSGSLDYIISYGIGDTYPDASLQVDVVCAKTSEGDVAGTAIDFGNLASCGGYYNRTCPAVTGAGTMLTDNFKYNVSPYGMWGE